MNNNYGEKLNDKRNVIRYLATQKCENKKSFKKLNTDNKRVKNNYRQFTLNIEKDYNRNVWRTFGRNWKVLKIQPYKQFGICLDQNS